MGLYFLQSQSCSVPANAPELEFTVNGQKVDLHSVNYLGDVKEEMIWQGKENSFLFEISKGFEEYNDQLYWNIDGKITKAVKKEKILMASSFEPGRVSFVGLCQGRGGPCVTLSLVRNIQEIEKKNQPRNYTDNKAKEIKAEENTNPQPPTPEKKKIVTPQVADNRSPVTEPSVSPIPKEQKAELRETDEELLQALEDIEFSRSAKVGFKQSNRCPEERRKWVDGIATLEIRPQVNLTLSSVKVLGSETGKVNIEIASSGKVIHRLTDRQILAGVPSEINFQYLNLILLKGRVYEITLRQAGNDLLFEDFSSCQTESKGNSQIALRPKKNGNIFFDISYSW